MVGSSTGTSLIVDSLGNVGIGTANPVGKFDVYQDLGDLDMNFRALGTGVVDIDLDGNQTVDDSTVSRIRFSNNGDSLGDLLS